MSAKYIPAVTRISIASANTDIGESKTITVLSPEYDGDLLEEAKFHYAPYAPVYMVTNPLNGPVTWRMLLDFISTVYRATLTDDDRAITKITPEQATAKMQTYFPGPYTVVEEFNVETNETQWKLHFEDKHEELLWHLKNSA